MAVLKKRTEQSDVHIKNEKAQEREGVREGGGRFRKLL